MPTSLSQRAPALCAHRNGGRALERESCLSKCTAALITVARSWGLPKGPSTGGRMNKLIYPCDGVSPSPDRKEADSCLDTVQPE